MSLDIPPARWYHLDENLNKGGIGAPGKPRSGFLGRGGTPE